MTTSSITAALPGTASSTSRGQSCPSACAIGHIGPDQRDLVLERYEPDGQPGDLAKMEEKSPMHLFRFFTLLFTFSLMAFEASMAQIAPATPNQQIVLWDAVIADDVTTAIAAIKAGADVNGLDTRANVAGPNGRRPLNYAAIRNDTAMITALLDAGANINSANRSGFTPLHHPGEAGSKEAATLLTAKGPKLTPQNRYAQTPD